jgi:adenosylcobinamide-GDP ribazoletransferase
MEDSDLARSLAYFPFVGLIIGSGLAVAAYVARYSLSAHLTALCVVTLLVVVTGGLHIDGLADVFDGLGGSRNRDRALAIMRDGRIGALGATALMLVLAAKAAALANVVGKDDFWTVLAFPALARWATTIVVVAHPYARAEGLGVPFRGATPLHAVMATGWIVPFVVACGTLRLPAFATLMTVLLFAWWVRRRIGGMTGDAYGAAIELGETAALLSASIDAQ